MMPFVTFKGKLALSEDAAFACTISGNPVDKVIYQLSKISDVSEKFKFVRKAVNMTQLEVAEYMGMSKRNVEYWESGNASRNEWHFPMYAYALLSKL